MVFWATTDPIEHISEEKSLLQIFTKSVGIFFYFSLTISIVHMVFWATTDPIEHISEEKSLLQIFSNIVYILI